jgi:hypothetical protein
MSFAEPTNDTNTILEFVRWLETFFKLPFQMIFKHAFFFLQSILQDWPDADGSTILQNIHAMAKLNSELALIEVVLGGVVAIAAWNKANNG